MREISFIKIEDMPRCPYCRNKNTVGRVRSVMEKRYKTSIGLIPCQAYYCSKCLLEWRDDGAIQEPLFV